MRATNGWKSRHRFCIVLDVWNCWLSAIQALINRDDPVTYGHSTINGRTIPPDRLITMFDLVDTALAAEIIAEFDRLDYQACFCSVFDECWTTSYSTFGTATQVDACVPSNGSFQE